MQKRIRSSDGDFLWLSQVVFRRYCGWGAFVLTACHLSGRNFSISLIFVCGQRVYSYHSCKNRSCPKCHGKDTARWLEKRRDELLPVGYFHLVFSLPEELRPHVRSNQQAMYTIIMKAAAKSIIKLSADLHCVGGLVGVMAVLHTWTRTMVIRQTMGLPARIRLKMASRRNFF